MLKVKVEEALWQLVAHGLASGDGIAGLRVLLTPEHKRVERRRSLRLISGGRSSERAMPVGRWSLWRAKFSQLEVSSTSRMERQARQLLQRYGVVFRDLLARESSNWPLGQWRNLLAIYRRLEARGEIRGGRFVNGFVGEQFALPEAVERLRELRRGKAVNQRNFAGRRRSIEFCRDTDPRTAPLALFQPVPRLPQRRNDRFGSSRRTDESFAIAKKQQSNLIVHA